MKQEISSLPILKKLLNSSSEEAKKSILKQYINQKYAIVNFLYFANTMKYKLFEDTDVAKDREYKKALLHGDFLLPDGIALELFYYITSFFSKELPQKRPTNLNGTDFIPYFMSNLTQGQESVHIGLYTTYDPVINKTLNEVEKAKINFHKKYGIPIAYSYAANYRDTDKKFPFDAYKQSLQKEEKKYNILLVCTGTPTQELWSYQNQDFFKENNILVFNAGGFVDFLSGFEKRAPKRVVKAKVLETFRRIITNPQKNLKKFLVMFGVIRFVYKKILYSVRNLGLKK